jgi:hypothetical protein
MSVRESAARKQKPRTKLTGNELANWGFEPVHNRDGVSAMAIGPSSARLTLVCGYQDSGWWAMVVKYPTKGSLESDASRCAHFPKRFYVMGDVHRLCAVLGINLQEPRQ